MFVRVPVDNGSRTGEGTSTIGFDRPNPERGGSGRDAEGLSDLTRHQSSTADRGVSTRGSRDGKSGSVLRMKNSKPRPDRDSTVQKSEKNNRLAAFLLKRKEQRGSGTTVDPRIAERAQKVREKEERKAFKRAIWLLGAMAAVGIGIWVIYSPYLAVRTVEVTGQVFSTASRHIRNAGISEGAPMLWIDEESLRQGLLADPWVEAVEIEKEWPGAVRIVIEERFPLAWVRTVKGWRALSVDGVELDVDSEQPMPHITGLAGAALDLSELSVAPALTFLDHLRPDLRMATMVEIHGAQVTAEVAGRVARLGRATAMGEKASVLGVLIDDHTDPGSVINLFSPLRPAVYRGTDSAIEVASPSS